MNENVDMIAKTRISQERLAERPNIRKSLKVFDYIASAARCPGCDEWVPWLVWINEERCPHCNQKVIS